jgi:hypothetical protein
MFSKIFLLFAYFNSTKPLADNSRAVTLYHPPKCPLRPTQTYLELITPRVNKVNLANATKHSKGSSKDSKKNHTNLRG